MVYGLYLAGLLAWASSIQTIRSILEHSEAASPTGPLHFFTMLPKRSSHLIRFFLFIRCDVFGLSGAIFGVYPARYLVFIRQLVFTTISMLLFYPARYCVLFVAIFLGHPVRYLVFIRCDIVLVSPKCYVTRTAVRVLDKADDCELHSK